MPDNTSQDFNALAPSLQRALDKMSDQADITLSKKWTEGERAKYEMSMSFFHGIFTTLSDEELQELMDGLIENELDWHLYLKSSALFRKAMWLMNNNFCDVVKAR